MKSSNRIPATAVIARIITIGSGLCLNQRISSTSATMPTASPNPLVQSFADFVRTSPIAGTIISKAGGVPAFNKK